MKRFKTGKPGVFYREADRIGGKGKERVFYVVFKKDGKVYEEKVGRQFADDMTPAKAALIRADRIEGRRESRKEIREARKAIHERWTMTKLWDEYVTNTPGLKSKAQDESKWRLHIGPALGSKEPSELVPLDIDRIRLKLLKSKSPATTRNVLELIRRIFNYAAKKQLCLTPGFKIEMPAVNNIKTEDLADDQVENLLRILRERAFTEKNGTRKELDRDACDAMLLALFTGMRRGEIFKLQWVDVDFRRGFIVLRDPKGGTDQTIPLSDAARELLKGRQIKGATYVFQGRKKRDGDSEERHKVDAAKHFREIRKAAGLPESFRPMHGLRHAFASRLASSGQVDLYTIQRLLTHKSPTMTQRYAHLRDDAMRSAANLAGSIVNKTAKDQESGEAAG